MEAKRRVELEESVIVNSAYKTLFYGLKRNHTHHMAVIHPITFIVRRVLFAVILLHMQGENVAFFGALMLLFGCMAILAIVSLEAQFIQRVINW